MIEIKLMADYECFPLWKQNMGEMGNINPHSLPISKSLANELMLWAEIYDETLNQDYPPDSGFKNYEEEIIFKSKGENLFKRLQSELGEGYLITSKSKASQLNFYQRTSKHG